MTQKSDKPLESKNLKQPVQSALRQPREFEKGVTSIFAQTNKTVKLPVNPHLFKGKVFYLEIFSDGNSMDSAFKSKIEELGGKVVKRLGPNVTHLVWSHGTDKMLMKAIQHENIKIVSTLWLTACEREMMIVEEEKHKPANLDKRLREARTAKIQTLTRQLKKDQSSGTGGKKRALSDLTQTKLYESSKKSKIVKSRESSNSKTNGKTTQSDTESPSQSVRGDVEEEKVQRPKIDVNKAITERQE